jgi:plasmid stabilization system protein ParE
MIYTLIYLEKAEEDIEKAFEYHEKIQANLGFRFEEDLDKTIDLIEKNPLHYRKINGENRQLLMSVFSYLVVYQVVEDKILIARIFHTSRNPKNKYKAKK